MSAVPCFVSVPVTSFRAPQAREYLETLPVPPPATVYGMLCSIVGEPDRLVHRGAELAIAVLHHGAMTRVLRTTWRIKDAKTPQGLGENKKPDFQELLTDVRLAVHVRAGDGERKPSLADRLGAALDAPSEVQRYGGVSLGESTALVDEIRRLRENDSSSNEPGEWLMPSPAGRLTLPVWVDHVGSAATRWQRFVLCESSIGATVPPDDAWIRIPTDD